MKIGYGGGTTEYGPGVAIELEGEEIAVAIDAFLVARGFLVSGPRTITVNGILIDSGRVYVDPSGSVITPGGSEIRGCGQCHGYRLTRHNWLKQNQKSNDQNH
jgi:hypothetical protein